MARKPTTVYCVQSYGWRKGKLAAGQARQFKEAAEAARVGEGLSARTAGVVVFSIEGEPEFDVWSEPRVLASYGVVPDATM